MNDCVEERKPVEASFDQGGIVEAPNRRNTCVDNALESPMTPTVTMPPARSLRI